MNELDRKLLDAAKAGNIKEVKECLEKGANVNATDTFGVTPLQWASDKGHLEVAKSLVEEGANVNAKDDWENTPLHDAFANDHLEIVRLLIEKGADVNAKQKYGQIPLVLYNRRDSQIANRNRRAMLELCIQYGMPDLIDVNDIEFIVWLIQCRETFPDFEDLIARGLDPNATFRGDPLLYILCDSLNDYNDKDMIKAIEILLRNGARVNERARNGDSAIDLMFNSFNYEFFVGVDEIRNIIRMLVQYGAKV